METWSWSIIYAILVGIASIYGGLFIYQNGAFKDDKKPNQSTQQDSNSDQSSSVASREFTCASTLRMPICIWNRCKNIGNCKLENHATILILAALGAFFLQFPITFIGRMININGEIPMQPSTQSQYYAVTFLPQQLKPIIALMVESSPLVCGRRYIPWLVLSNIGIAMCALLIGLVATQVWHMFVLGTVQSLMEAISNMILYLLMIQNASKDKQKIGKLNAELMTSRYFGTLMASLFALPVGGCFGDGWNNRLVICVSSAVPVLSALVSLWFPERRVSPEPPAAEEEELVPASQRRRSVVQLFGIVFAITLLGLFQALVIVLSLNSLFQSEDAGQTWTVLVGILSALFGSLVIAAFIILYRLGGSRLSYIITVGIPCVYLIVIDAIPWPLNTMYSYQYTTISDQCELVELSLVTSVTSMMSPYLYVLVFSQLKIELGLLCTTLLQSMTCLLYLILAYQWPNSSPIYQWMLISIMINVSGTLLNMAKEVVCTMYAFILKNEQESASFHRVSIDEDAVDTQEFAEDEVDKKVLQKVTPGVLFGIYIACFDVGASAAGFVNAAVMDALEITYTDYSNLPQYIFIGAISMASTFIFMPFITCTQHRIET